MRIKVSLFETVNVTTPDEFVVPTNCLRTVNCVSLTPLLVSVKRVLIVVFGNLNNAIFFSASFNLATVSVSKPNTSPKPASVPSSKIMLSPESPLEVSVPSKIICPTSPEVSKTKSNSKVFDQNHHP